MRFGYEFTSDSEDRWCYGVHINHVYHWSDKFPDKLKAMIALYDFLGELEYMVWHSKGQLAGEVNILKLDASSQWKERERNFPGSMDPR